MGIARVSLKRSKTGIWQGRKEIPEGIRPAYGKREEKCTWPAHLTDAQALAEYLQWRAKIESEIDLHKQKLSGAGLVRLTRQQAKALAGVWYRDAVNGEGEIDLTAPDGSQVDWEATRALLFDEVYDTETTEVRLVPGLQLIDARDELLRSRDLKVTDDSAAMLLEELGQLHLAYFDRLQRREAGDTRPDPALVALPPVDVTLPAAVPQKPKTPPKAAVSITDLFERYAQSGAASVRTCSKWRPQVRNFVEHVGHDDATKVTRGDLNRWVEALVAKPLAKKTITDSYIPAVRVALGIAYDDELILSNPASGLKVRAPKAVETKDKDHSDEAAETILKATLTPQPDALTERHKLARRWVPWICAYTGARVGEVTQLRAMDIRQESGVWVYHITPEAGSTKDSKARSIPIHSHLIEQGILQLAKAGDATPLFYDLPKNGGSLVNPLPKQRASKLAEWVRGLGVTTPQPNHGWRHRFKTVARSAGIDAEIRDAIQGHVPRTEGEKYGKQPLPVLQAAVEKLPRYATS
ncbi:tyrosine-type recombinase/integrase [Sphingomonas sp. LaA6.9]|uniref:tyrosine-type recombinase/integrase n=1 Tax=Sphingomonas sp. LaA6.9 TaxID=2919914 RepID=UPI001F4FCF7C|nr:tyrosine-type recombinase/integrase [Sphingomonas sp. LaA6.9]MCJ8158654.1 tyrosine-type recombinase/integrase [Sphingomonas sp. LaA6.9]